MSLGEARAHATTAGLRVLECRHVVWDEPNLEYNEANKSSTMKIDEPDTPWVSPRAHSSDGTCTSSLLCPLEYTARVHQLLAWVHSCAATWRLEMTETTARVGGGACWW